MNNKKIEKKVMRRAGELKIIPDEQSGSKKNRQSTALNKVLVTYISK